jgi:hypothetical protein
MSKLLKLKKWVTLEDAAQYLTISLGEPVSKAQLLKFGIDGLLALSVYFPVEQSVLVGEVWSVTEGKKILVEKKVREMLEGRPELDEESCKDFCETLVKTDLRIISRGYCFVPDGEDLFDIIGDWEILPMGSGKQFLIDQYNNENEGVTHGRDVVYDYSEGFLVKMNSSGSFGFLVRPYGATEMEKLMLNVIDSNPDFPKDFRQEFTGARMDAQSPIDNSSLVVSTASLRRFEQSIEEQQEEEENTSELTYTTKQTYLALIGALLEKVLELSPPNATQKSIAGQLEDRYNRNRNGFGKSSLEKIFSKSKRALIDKLK